MDLLLKQRSDFKSSPSLVIARPLRGYAPLRPATMPGAALL
jgi:hypothetical protein